MSKKSQRVQFVDAIANVCGAPRSTVRNTKEDRLVDYSTKLNRAQESNARPFLMKLGFKDKFIPSTGGSTFGDFSSDVYGSNYYHPNGAWVSVFSSFRADPATFNIIFDGTEEQAKGFMEDPAA
jgi:hypothetical protein